MKVLWSLILVILLCSCAQNEENVVTPPNNTTPNGTLIKSYTINNQWEYAYAYNSNNTLREVSFKEEGTLKHTEVYTYENGKIVELVKQDANGANTTRKQFEYEGNLIVKQTLFLNGELFETSNFSYNEDTLERIVATRTVNNLTTTETTTIQKVGENKIRVKKTNRADHVITFDDKVMPQAIIPGYKALVQISNNGLTNNILLKEIFVGDTRTTTITTDFEYNEEVVISSKTTFKANNLLEVQEFKYTY